MKKQIGYTLSIVVLVLMMASFTTVYAGDAQEKDTSEAAATTQEIVTPPAVAGITVSGTINDANQLIDDNGQAFKLSESTEQGLEVKALVGQKVQLKGTVMEEAGQNIMEVQEYKILGSN